MLSRSNVLWSRMAKSKRDLSYYSLLNHFIVSRLYGGELKHCTFGCGFTKHAQDFGIKFHIVSNKHCDQQCGENTEQQDNSEPWLCGWGSPTPCTGQCPLEEIDQSNWLFIHYFKLEPSNLSSFWNQQQPVQQILKRRHLVTWRNMGCFQGLAILIVVCTVIICALQILCFFLSRKTRDVSSSRIKEHLNGHNREPGNPRKINIQWPHLNRRKQPIEHSEQPFNQVGFMTIT